MQAKICGLTKVEHVEACVTHDASFCGFILNYKKSHRFVDYEKAYELTKVNKRDTSYVGVLVEPTDKEIKTFSNMNLDYFKIYGNIR